MPICYRAAGTGSRNKLNDESIAKAEVCDENVYFNCTMMYLLLNESRMSWNTHFINGFYIKCNCMCFLDFSRRSAARTGTRDRFLQYVLDIARVMTFNVVCRHSIEQHVYCCVYSLSLLISRKYDTFRVYSCLMPILS